MSAIFTTLIFISLLSCVALTCIQFILNNNPKLVVKNHRFFLICLIIIGLRLFIPLDLPAVHIIRVTEILPTIFLFLYKNIFSFGEISFSLFTIFTYVWILGSLYCFFKLIYSYFLLFRMIHGLAPFEDPKTQGLVDHILTRYKKPVHFHLVTTDLVTTPLVFGIRKPYIIIPQISLAEADLEYVLAHEIAHYYQGDLYIKFFFEIFHAIYWWNPLYYIIKNQISTLLEINVDIRVSRQYEHFDKLCYLECLLKVAKLQDSTNDTKFLAAFNGDSTSSISKRIKIVITDMNFTNTKSSALISYGVTLFLTLCILVIPTFFTIAPYGTSDEVKEYFLITKENAYFIQLEDGTYDLYVDGNFMVNMSNPDLFEDPIPIH